MSKEIMEKIERIGERKIKLVYSEEIGDLKILEYMVEYIVNNIYNGDIDIKEYIFKYRCLDSGDVEYILEIIDVFS